MAGVGGDGVVVGSFEAGQWVACVDGLRFGVVKAQGGAAFDELDVHGKQGGFAAADGGAAWVNACPDLAARAGVACAEVARGADAGEGLGVGGAAKHWASYRHGVTHKPGRSMDCFILQIYTRASKSTIKK